MLKGLILELSASNMKSEFTEGFPFPRFYMKHSATSPPPPPPPSMSLSRQLTTLCYKQWSYQTEQLLHGARIQRGRPAHSFR